MKFLLDEVLSAASAASSQSSNPTDATTVIRVSAQAVFTDPASTGTIKFQGSNDRITASNLPGLTTVTNWSDIPNTSVAVTAGGVVLIPATDVGYQWLRFVFTRTAGAGTITATIKTINY